MDSSVENEKTTKRKPNWTDEDSKTLVMYRYLFHTHAHTHARTNKLWIFITVCNRINSASVTCGTRDVDDVKRRWKDIKLRVKKKEALRKQLVRKTGGGSPPDITFKPWEDEVLSLIPEESISGLEGAVDTDLNELSAVPSKSAGCQNESATNAVISAVGPPEEPFIGRKKCTDLEDQQMERLIELKRERLIAEKGKATALERIAEALEAKMKK
uniref:Uncharacterized protein LOC111101956 n=1 Tax=Crassostrea virginica TaxID=6565 RepID=A0A8B8AIE6_CRAVI|nr:uncharacterized protein LOC111101956 [Crassostrea virginica]